MQVRLTMTFSHKFTSATLFMAVVTFSSPSESRLVDVAFALDEPKTKLETKMFNDRARLEAQALMLDLHFAGVSFVPSTVMAPHRQKLNLVLRSSFYKSVLVTGLEVRQRKKVDGKWQFAFRGVVPDIPPLMTDDVLISELLNLIRSRSAIITPEFAMELALAYPELNFFDDALLFWQNIFAGHSHAMISGQSILDPDDFALSARTIKPDRMPSDLPGVFNLLDQAPFNPHLCERLFQLLDAAKLPSLKQTFEAPCLTLEKTSPRYQYLAALTSQASTVTASKHQWAQKVIDEVAMLEKGQLIDSSAWLTRLVINSLGDVPAKFAGKITDTSHELKTHELILEPIEMNENSDEWPQVEPLGSSNLQEKFRDFEKNPTKFAMMSLATTLKDEGYSETAHVFYLQAGK